MEFFKQKVIVTAILSALVLPTSVFATNGMHAIGNGAKARAMGGAGVALANENGSIAANPAAVVKVGDRLDVSLALFTPSPRAYRITDNTVTDPSGILVQGTFNENQNSTNDLFLIPAFGMTFPIDDKSSWSFGMAAAGGMNTEYKRNFGAKIFTIIPAESGHTGINLEQLFVSGTYGRQLNSDTSVGISLLYAYQTFRATGLGVFGKFGASEDATKLSDNGNDESSGTGYKIGMQTRFSNFRLGITYQPKVKMDKFKKYKGLFANQGEMDIPALYAIGTAFDVSHKLSIVFDYQYIDYADVAAIGNSIKNLDTTGGVLFGSTNGPGFGWKSINVYKLGISYGYSKQWVFRAGYNKGDNPIPKGEYSLAFVAPAVITDHLTFGFTNTIDKSSEYSMNFVHSFNNKITDDFVNQFGGGDITVEMEQNLLEIAYSKLF